MGIPGGFRHHLSEDQVRRKVHTLGVILAKGFPTFGGFYERSNLREWKVSLWLAYG